MLGLLQKLPAYLIPEKYSDTNNMWQKYLNTLFKIIALNKYVPKPWI